MTSTGPKSSAEVSSGPSDSVDFSARPVNQLRYQLEQSASQGDVTVGRSGNDVVANVRGSKANTVDLEPSGDEVETVAGPVDREAQVFDIGGSTENVGHWYDDEVPTGLLEESRERKVHNSENLPKPVTREIRDGGKEIDEQDVAHEANPSTAQSPEGDAAQRSTTTVVVPLLAEKSLHEDVKPNDGVQYHDMRHQVPILASTVTATSPTEDAEGTVYNAAGSGNASRPTPHGPASISQEAPAQPPPLSNIGDFQNFATTLDIDSSDLDSSMGETDQSSTVSLDSELYQNVEENGRSYHRYKEGKYVLPNDEAEQNRLDMQHHLFLLTLHGELHIAPLKPGIHNALDIATGTGIWAIDFATKYPSADVIGTDLSPIQPLFVPPNCRFEVDDAEDEWVYSHSFDYIHGRLFVSCFRAFPSIVAKAYEALQPGGWFELQDTLPLTCLDDSWNGTELQRWTNLTLEGAAKMGLDWYKAAKYKAWLEEAGFVDVQEMHFAWPINTWPKNPHLKRLGIWMNQ